MQKSLIKQILLEQKEEIKGVHREKPVKREIEPIVGKMLKDNLIKVIVGVRRCGKSFLAHQVLGNKKYGYINFDDERLINVRANDLNDFLEILEEIEPNFSHLLLDEIQNIEGWELFANRLKRNGYNLIITGSNSKLLSKELASHLTGRHRLIELYPFSFQEFLRSKNLEFKESDFYLTPKRARLNRALDEYIKFGGFPELSKIESKEQYLRDLYAKVIARDIVSRYKVKHLNALKEIALYGLSNFGSKITYHKLKNIFEIRSVHTIKNYLDYLEEAYLLFQLFPFSFKLKERIKGARKVYGIDTGLIGSVSSLSSANQGRLIENVVFLELKRRGQEIYFYTDSLGKEIDFVIKEGLKIKQLIQVCFDASDLETIKREISSLIKGSEHLKCANLLVITWNKEAQEKIKGRKINYIPLWKWLLTTNG